jgi:glutamate 5-kinase
MSLLPSARHGEQDADEQEIKFGDNDTLSAISSSIVHADYLFLLTDVECLYTDNPRSNPDAKPVRVVRDIEKVKRQGMPFGS